MNRKLAPALATLTLLFSLFFALPAFATWTNGIQAVAEIVWRPGMQGFYVSAANFHDPESCGGAPNLYLIDPSLDEKTVSRLYAMLLVARLTGKTLTVW